MGIGMKSVINQFIDATASKTELLYLCLETGAQYRMSTQWQSCFRTHAKSWFVYSVGHSVSVTVWASLIC